MFKVIDLKTNKEANYHDLPFDPEEKWLHHLAVNDMEGFAIEDDGTLIILDECGGWEFCPEGRFKVVWENNGCLKMQYERHKAAKRQLNAGKFIGDALTVTNTNLDKLQSKRASLFDLLQPEPEECRNLINPPDLIIPGEK